MQFAFQGFYFRRNLLVFAENPFQEFVFLVLLLKRVSMQVLGFLPLFFYFLKVVQKEQVLLGMLNHLFMNFHALAFLHVASEFF